MRYIIFLLIFFSFGCVGALPKSDMSYSVNTSGRDKPENVDNTIPVLMTLGGASMIIGGGIASYQLETGDEEPVVPAILIGSGLVLWGAAGIYYIMQGE